MENRLEALQARRDEELSRILGARSTPTPPEKLAEEMDQNLFSAVRVAMRVKKFHEAKDEIMTAKSRPMRVAWIKIPFLPRGLCSLLVATHAGRVD